jgi:V/A-type H+/Na+-transporting ATPase subunit A
MTAAARGRAGARIVSLNGPVLRCAGDGTFSINEAIEVGSRCLSGEVLRLEGRDFVAQIYEDTTGLRPGEPVYGTGLPLAVYLSPALLGGIFDGLLRPLSGAQAEHVLPGCLREDSAPLRFTPALRAGDRVAGGAVLGQVERGGGRPQRCLLPPDAAGEVVAVAAAGEYTDRQPVCTVRGADGAERTLALGHRWPVRQPRPARARLPADAPLLTGQRILDALFPVARGSCAAMPGGFGTGKTVLQQSIAKWCDADVIVYVGCGERGNEMAEVLHELPQLEDPRSGRPLIERSVIIANTSNMPVAAREASIYTGVTVAEYFRDQGLHVALMADSTSRWAEALREISGRLGELPAEGGYPAYLGTRKAEFYERAARVTTLAGEEGSVTLIGAVSPPGGDFSEPVTLHTQRNVRAFWPLDRDRARARFYPAIHPLQAYSEDAPGLAAWWRERGHPERERQRERFLTLLEQEAHLQRMARIVGKEALPAKQRLTLLNAELLNEAFLRQSSFSKVDAFASPERQTAMMRLLDRFFDASEQALAAGAPVAEIERLPVLRRLRRMGEEIGNDALPRFKALLAQAETELAGLRAPAAPATDAGAEAPGAR